jgi:Na+/melibiose symporter-like transporter
LLKATTTDFEPAAYAQSALVSGIKWMFVLIPIILLSICLVFAIRNKVNKRRFDAILHGIDSFQKQGNLSALTQQERDDIHIVTGEPETNLWGGK